MRLIGELSRLQDKHGCLSDEQLRGLAARLNVPLYRLQGLVSFYPHFRSTPPPAASVSVCRDMSCHLRGAATLAAAVEAELAPERASGAVEVQRVSCLGRCDAAPAVCVNDTPLPAAPHEPGARAAAVAAWARDPGSIPAAQATPSGASWAADHGRGPFQVLAQLLGRQAGKAGGELEAATATEILATLKAAELRGMGGAGFPTAVKWQAVRDAGPGEKYVVVNADESEPGTFKDRVILQDLSHLVVEGAAVAALVTGARKIIFYIRHEYVPERLALQAACDAFAALKLAPLEMTVFVSPGGYILGEETALLEALEDRRGEPRNKPPFPVTHGLYGKPTVINNVETLAWVPLILDRGADWWKAQGAGDCTGLKFMALSGHVEKPGVYLVPMGTPMADLVQLGGGITQGRKLQALAPGGASSPFLPAAALDTPLDFAALKAAGSMLGSGAVVAVAEGTDLLELATNVVAFFRNESCGKCVPCRTGSEKAVRILEEVLEGRGRADAVALLPELGETLELTSICGLGQVALNPILSVMRHFPDLMPRRLPRAPSA